MAVTNHAKQAMEIKKDQEALAKGKAEALKNQPGKPQQQENEALLFSL